eukprot:12398398-Heterocapsa_arctica.AAC.1
MIDVGRPLSVDESSTEVVRGPVKAYTDGGSEHPADPRTRRSGWGIWVHTESYRASSRQREEQN